VSAPSERPRGPSFVREPRKWTKWWLNEKPPTNRNSFVTAVWSLPAFTLLTLLGGLAIKQFGPAGNVPGYLLVITGGICLTVGIAVSWVLTRKNYELVLRTGNAELEKAQAQLKQMQAELQLERERRASFEPSRATLARFGVYSEHLYSLVGGLIARELSFVDLESDAISRSVYEVVQANFLEATGNEVRLSIWTEPTEPRIRERISGAVSERLPGAVSELLPAKPKFSILAAPDHTPNERKDFEVAIDPSWLKYKQRQEDGHADLVVFRADTPTLDELSGDDVEAFRKYGYQSVRAISFQRDELIVYLVVMSRTLKAFSEVEEQYLVWLKRAIEVDTVLGLAAAPTRESMVEPS
jgi:hypothetical protein